MAFNVPPSGAGTVTSVTGTTNRVTSTGGATPSIDISAAYVGQSSITTLGTIASGTWNGTAVDATHGGTNQTTWTTGDLLYASASNTLSKLALATTVGSRLMYDGTNVYWYDPLKDLYMEDDFFGMLSSGSPTSATGWEANNNGTGATAGIQNNPTIADATHPGTITLSTGSILTNYSGLIASQNNNQGVLLLGGGEINQYWIINIPVLSNGTDRFSVIAGLMMFNSTPTVNSGIWFGYVDNVNGGAFTINTANNGSVTTTNSTSAAVTANTWYKLRININAAGTLATYFVNGVSVGTISTNIPVTTGSNNFFITPAAYIVKSVGINSLTLVLDKHILFQKMTSSR